jgi:betaine reductase
MTTAVRVLHYLNQFFGGRGGEEAAGMPVSFVEGPVGPGRPLTQRLGGAGRIVGTVVGGDAYVAEQAAAATSAFADLLRAHRPDVVLAGPAFESGRYGVACVRICNTAVECGVPAVAAMHPANPGLGLRVPGSYVIPTAAHVSGMGEAVDRLARLGLRLARRDPLGPAAVEGYLPTGDRRPVLHPEPGHTRALAMLLTKLNTGQCRSELEVIQGAPPAPALPIADLRACRLALITSGGLVPRGNPDRMPRRYSRHRFEYDLPAGPLVSGEWESIHAGYHVAAVNANPNVVVPLDAMRRVVAEGRIASLCPRLQSLAGVGTPDTAARAIAQELADSLRRDGAHGAIMVAT